jgi:hypothetical protein
VRKKRKTVHRVTAAAGSLSHDRGTSVHPQPKDEALGR